MRSISCAILLATLGCSASEGPAPLRFALTDPREVLARVGGELRLLVLPASYSCDETTGSETPSAGLTPDAPVLDAKSDLRFSASAGVTVQLIPGDYTVVVHGWGTDPVLDIPGSLVASGCSEVTLASSATRELRIALRERFARGTCGDDNLTADEQCDDNNTMDGDGCAANCTVEPERLHSTTMLTQRQPRLAWRADTRAVLAFASDSPGIGVRFTLLDDQGARIHSPTFLELDDEPERIVGTENDPSVAIGGDRALLSWSGFGGAYNADGMGDVRVQGFDLATRSELAASATVAADESGQQNASRIAANRTGAALVVWQDSHSATGLSARFFAANMTTPAGAAVDIPSSAMATAPHVSAHDNGFVVVFVAAQHIYGITFDESGTPSTVAIDLSGDEGSAPAVASLDSGETLVVWQSTDNIIRARLFDEALVAAGDAFTISTTEAGTVSAPVVAAGLNRFAVAWSAGSAIRGRFLNETSAPLLNRATPVSTADFSIVANGSEPTVAVGGAGYALFAWRSRANDAGDIYGSAIPLP